jgi:xylan 1,4-beta-xylosidase
VISAKGTEGPIQRTGHGQYVETHANGGYHSFLMGRPKVGPHGLFCALGRESGIEQVVWRDGWLWLDAGGMVSREAVPGLADVEPAPDAAVVRDFAVGVLPEEFQWLRTPYPERLFRVEPGALVLTGRESPGSWFEQALVARRQEHHVYHFEMTLDFSPETYQQGAGLTTYYNRHKFHAAIVTHEEGVGRCIRVMSCPGDWPAGRVVMLDCVAIGAGPVEVSVDVDGAEQRFRWRQGGDWAPLGPVLDASVISDEGGQGEHASFTGAFVGAMAFDLTGQGREARVSRTGYWPGGT